MGEDAGFDELFCGGVRWGGAIVLEYGQLGGKREEGRESVPSSIMRPAIEQCISGGGAEGRSKWARGADGVEESRSGSRSEGVAVAAEQGPGMAFQPPTRPFYPIVGHRHLPHLQLRQTPSPPLPPSHRVYIYSHTRYTLYTHLQLQQSPIALDPMLPPSGPVKSLFQLSKNVLLKLVDSKHPFRSATTQRPESR